MRNTPTLLDLFLGFMKSVSALVCRRVCSLLEIAASLTSFDGMFGRNGESRRCVCRKFRQTPSAHWRRRRAASRIRMG